jgi:hypothetical protein
MVWHGMVWHGETVRAYISYFRINPHNYNTYHRCHDIRVLIGI